MTPEGGAMDRARCTATDTLTYDGQPLVLQCVHWGEGGLHLGDHLVHTQAIVDDHTWPNDNPAES